MKTPPTKESWQALRERYTWHLRPPFKDQFDRSHWWKGKQAAKHRATPQPPYVFGGFAPSTVEENGDATFDPVAALYELARRHPTIGELRLKMNGEAVRKSLSDATNEIHCLLKVGLKSWPKLTRKEQMSWQSSVGNRRGVDCRPESEQCYSITSSASVNISLRERFGDLKKDATSVDDKERQIASCAVEAHRKGYLLFALAPDLSADKAANLLSRQYDDRRSHFWRWLSRKNKPRARCESWLGVIADFEKVATDPKHEAKSPVFTLYRRVVEGPKPS